MVIASVFLLIVTFTCCALHKYYNYQMLSQFLIHLDMDQNLLFDDYKSGERPIIVTGFHNDTTRLELDRTFADLGLEVMRMVLIPGKNKAIVHFREKSKYQILEVLHRKPVYIGEFFFRSFCWRVEWRPTLKSLTLKSQHLPKSF